MNNTGSKSEQLENIKALSSFESVKLNSYIENVKKSKAKLVELEAKFRDLLSVKIAKGSEVEEDKKNQNKISDKRQIKAVQEKDFSSVSETEKSKEVKEVKTENLKNEDANETVAPDEKKKEKASFIVSRNVDEYKAQNNIGTVSQNKKIANNTWQRPQYTPNTRNSRFNNNRTDENRPRDYSQNQNRGQFASANKNFIQKLEPVPVSQSGNRMADKEIAKRKLNEKLNGDKKIASKKTLIKKGFVNVDTPINLEDEDYVRTYKLKKQKKSSSEIPVTVIESAVVTSDKFTIKHLSEKIGKTAVEIIKKLFILGFNKTINESIDFDVAQLVADELGVKLELKMEKSSEDKINDLLLVNNEKDEVLVERPPVVTIMGHVDHGKTSLLDYIRKSNVVSSEAGGITQHIGAYTVTHNGKPITFLDTPGHEAFTAMRQRGAQATDIAVIVVAGDDGVMPQTIEAINHAKGANVSIIIAITKIDKPNCDVEKIKQQLTSHDILPEEWGGDAIVVPLSSKSGQGVDKLLESILLVAEIKELKANPKRFAQGVIIEAKLDKGKGPVATVLVQNGTLKISNYIIAGTSMGRVRAMIDDKGKNVKSAGPSVPVSILGFNDVPNAGDILFAMNDEKLIKQVLEERLYKEKSEMSSTTSNKSLEDMFKNMADNELKHLNVIIKGDVQGSVEAIKESLIKMSDEMASEGVKISIVHSAVGAVTESDIMLADTTNSIVIAFNVRPDNNARTLAERVKVDIKSYRIIYDIINDIKLALKGLFEPKFVENIIGHAEVRNTFKVPSAGIIAGSYVTDGKIIRGAKARLLRDNIIICDTTIASLRRFKDDAKEVASGYECGIGLENFSDIKEKDIIEVYSIEQEEVK